MTKEICAWCKATMKEGDEPVSHGICCKCTKDCFGKGNGHSWGPPSLECTSKDHIEVRSCTTCGVRETLEADNCPSECSECASFHYASPQDYECPGNQT
jgi:hypothetical protein